MKRLPILCLVAMLMSAVPVYAQAIPYDAYVFDRYDRAAPAPASFKPLTVARTTAQDVGAMKQPSDLFAAPDGLLYVADTGNARILALDTDYQVVKVLDTFWDEDGEPFTFESPSGLYVAEDGRMHVADPSLREVITLDAEGRIINRIGRPDSEMLAADFYFTPTAVLEDQTGVLFILSRGCYQGALMVDPWHSNMFLGFYGTSEVQMTFSRLAQTVWKRIFTREQRTRMTQHIPVEYSNFKIDDHNFVYTCSAFTENNIGQLRKLNAASQNVLRVNRPGGMNYGDPIAYDGNYIRVTSAFIDITCDPDGLIYALDRTRGRVFVYDEDSNLVAVFGKLGDQMGCFTLPSAIEYYNGQVVVLDATRGELTVFDRTEYGEKVHTAVLWYNDGKYAESTALWREVLTQNTNYELAYLGIGRGLAKTGELKESLWYLRQAQNKKVYGDIYDEYRTEWLKAHFDTLATMLLAAVAVLVLYLRRKRLKALLGRFKRGGGGVHA